MAHAADHGDTSPDTAPRLRVGRLLRRVYLFEWVAAASIVAFALFAVLGPARTQYILLGALTFRRMLVVALLAVILATGVTLIRRRAGGGGVRAAWAAMPWKRTRFWTDALRIVVATSVVDTTHLLLKAFIPAINPANYDPLLARLDEVLLGPGGVARVAAALMHHSTFLHVLDMIYSGLYFFVLGGGLVACFALLDERRRIQFFGSFCLMWQVGLLLYVLLPSWGPVFVRPDAFTDVLQSMPATVRVQHALFLETSAIVQHHFDTVIRFFGLAAFPSLHVAVVFLFTLWARPNRLLFTVLLVLTAIMLLGSMVTGYHYLVDGLAGLLLAAFVFIVGRHWPLPSNWAKT